MYTRVSLFQFDANRLDEIAAKLSEVEPAIKKIPGIITAYICWRGDGQAVSFAVYPSESHAEQALAQVQAVWSDVSEMLVGSPQTEIYSQGQSYST